MNFRRVLLRTISVFLICGAVIWWWLAAPTGMRRDSSQRPSATKVAGDFRLEDERSVFSTYGGSASCKSCHEEEFALWQKSNHGLAERAVEPSLDSPAFYPARNILHGIDQSAVQIRSSRFEVTTTGPSGTSETFVVQRVIGNDPLRQFLVPFPGGRLQTLQASYDPHRNEWFDVFGDEGRKPGEWGHWTGRGMNWNSMCAACHNTRVRKNYDASGDAYHTTMAEMTVGCEACHGPLKAHNDWQAQFGKSGRKDPTLQKLTRGQIVDYCGFCHARRTDLTGDFKPGDSFNDHFVLAMVDYSDVFYADGQNRDEDYEYSAFLGSRMNFRGVACLDCHNPHSGKTLLPGNWLCMRCHNGTYTNAPVIDPVGHGHHKVYGYGPDGKPVNFDLMNYKPNEIKETGGECVNCHMPQTAYMQRHWRHDHGLTIPDPLLTKQHGVPNACNRCHADKDVNWSLQWVDQWYGAKMERPTRVRAQWIAQARKGESAARQGLLNLLGREEIAYWRAVEAGLLGPWAGEPDVRDALLRLSNDTNSLVRAAAIQALGSAAEDNAPAVTEAIRRRLDDPARNVRIAAAWALRGTLDSSAAAAGDLEHYLDFNADQPAGQMQLGAWAFSRDNPQQALLHLQKAVAWDPYSPPLHEELAVVLSAANRPQEAVAQLQEASRLAPRDAEVHYKLGLACNEIGNLSQAVAELEQAVQLDPRHARAWYNLGLAQNASEQPEKALESLIRAESADSQDARIPYARATILARLGRVAEARDALRRALELQSSFPEARQLLEDLSH